MKLLVNAPTPQLFALIPLASCTICTAFAFTVLARDPSDRLNRALALLLFAPAYWAFFEAAAVHARSPEVALAAVLFSTPGWVFVAPLTVNLMVAMNNREEKSRLRNLRPWLFAAAAGLTLLNWSHHSLSSRAIETSWGYTFEVGPGFAPYVLFTLLCGLGAVFEWLRVNHDAPILGDHSASGMLTLGVLSPIAVVSFTDAIFPILGSHVPRLGTASFALLALAVLAISVRRGYVFASPGEFAREIVETLPDGVAFLSPDGRIRFMNEGLQRCAGLAAGPLIGTRFDRFVRQPRLAVGENLCEVESEFVRPSGERFPICLSTCTIMSRRGRPLGLVAVIRSIQEVATLRRRLVTSGRLAAVGQLAAGIAHEINNPLAFVRANLSVLRQHWQELEKQLAARAEPDCLGDILNEGEEIIDESLEGIDRAANIVRDVREFSHTGGQHREWANLNELLDRVIRVATPGLAPTIHIERRYGELPLVLSSPQQLKQVFLNLIVNAVHAVGEAGTICLSTRVEGDEAVVKVEDDGYGIPDEIVDRIFDPFFTTKAVGKGTGLGLSISYEIIRSHNGEIAVESKTGRGTCLCVRLPIGGEEDTPDRSRGRSGG